MTQITAKWKNSYIAIMLGMKDFIIDFILKNRHKDCAASCQDMLKHWLNEERHTSGGANMVYRLDIAGP